MRTLTYAAALATTALFGLANSASADTLSYNILVNGTSIGSGSTPTGLLEGATAVSATGDGFTVTLNAIAPPAQSAPNFSTSTFNVSDAGTAGTLMIEVTDTGLTSPTTTTMNTFTTNSLDGGGFLSDTITNYYDNTDAAYGEQNTLATASYSGLGSFSTGPTASVLTPTGTYSESTIYTLNFGTGNQYSSVNASSQIVAATPEPNSLVLLGTGLVGAAGLLFMRRRNEAEGLL